MKCPYAYQLQMAKQMERDEGTYKNHISPQSWRKASKKERDQPTDREREKRQYENKNKRNYNMNY